METQKKFKFDTKTLVKILKGALISGVGAGAIAILQFIGGVDLQSVCTETSEWVCNFWLTPFVAWVVPTGTNAIKEFIKGE